MSDETTPSLTPSNNEATSDVTPSTSNEVTSAIPVTNPHTPTSAYPESSSPSSEPAPATIHEPAPATSPEPAPATIHETASTTMPSLPNEDDKTNEDDNNAGLTVIADIVVAKIAGLAAREVPGVYELINRSSKTGTKILEQIPTGLLSSQKQVNLQQGITVSIHQHEVSITVDIIAEYGLELTALADRIRNRVADEVEKITGLTVTEVNIVVNDVHVVIEETSGGMDFPSREAR